jgi:FMN phosphatase YigB (HAD superfamily)
VKEGVKRLPADVTLGVHLSRAIVGSVRALARRNGTASGLPHPQLHEAVALWLTQQVPPALHGWLSAESDGDAPRALRMTRPVHGGVPFDGLQEAIESAAGACRVVAFDLFDTLLRRRVEPEWVKSAVAIELSRWLGELLGPAAPGAAAVRRRRSELELEIARERVARGDDDEVDYDDLLGRWVATWVAPGEARSRLVKSIEERELVVEQEVLFPAPGAKDLLAWVRRRLGTRVIFVSDMYLGERRVRRLLAACGLEDQFDAGYVSIDHGARKATGRLFQRVLAIEGLQPSELLFVGDNPTSDCAEPRRLGIRTVLVSDAPERARRNRLRAAHRAADRNPAWRAHLVDDVVGSMADPGAPGDPSWRLGRWAAPSLTAFALSVLEKARSLDLDAVFFLSREGLVLQRVYRILKCAEARRPPPDRYLFVSRASTFLASMRELSAAEVDRYTGQYRRQSLADLLRNLSLPAAPFLPVAAACGIEDPDRGLDRPTEDPAFRRFFEHPTARAVFAEHRDRARALLRRYLEAQGVFGCRRVGFVDIGWKGSIQDNVVRAFDGDARFPEVHGLYLACHHGGDRHARSFKSGFLADTRREDPDEIDLFRNSSAFEMVTTADHGTTVGYRSGRHDPTRVVPVLKQHDLERANAEHFFSRAQEAIYAYARAFAGLRAALPFEAEELRPGVLHGVLRYVRYPTREEALEFARYAHVESFGVDEVTRFGLGLDIPRLLVTRAPWAAARDFYREFHRNPWREGVVRRSGIPLGNLLYDLYRTLRIELSGRRDDDSRA